MQRNLLFKLIFVLALVAVAVISLVPTFQLGGLKNSETAMINELATLTGLEKAEVRAGVSDGDLESLVRQQHIDDETKAVEMASELIQLSTKVAKVEGRAILQGLDLQGGTYLVYEADLPDLLLLPNIAKNKDQRLEDIVAATQKQVDEEGVEFFPTLQENFKARNVAMSRYYGRKGQDDDEVLKALEKEADDAVDRTLEVLRNRVDQFGVSEPIIQKQGKRRIEIELAGIQDIQRAKSIIGKTALLEFKLVKDPEIVISVINDIDKVVKTLRAGEELAESVNVEAEADTSVEDGEAADDKEVSLSDLFGDQSDDSEASGETDDSIVVDENTFSDKPFTALLRQLPGRNIIFVLAKNQHAVQKILAMPEVQQVVPSDTEFMFGKDYTQVGEDSYLELYLLKREAELTGDYLTEAQVQIGQSQTSLRAGEASISMSLNNEGAKIFARVTGMNVNKQLAIVLDGKVASAPNIKERIPHGSAKIDVQNLDEAKDLALVLRAGSLPAPVHPITENTVGPSLGHDSIKKGQMSVVIGLSLVIIFMVIYYRLSGLIADLALLLNMAFVFAIMAGFHATLTLPGIAGIILTVGMAVDANVLIFERIREEMRSGKTTRAAIDSGYGRAFSTILDANITTLITAIVLYSFGTGPIKGFALTLSIGIVASMFTAIFVTRLVFDIATSRVAMKKLSI